MPRHSKIGVCDVDRIVDHDTTMKQVTYCHFCDAWICEKCWMNYPKRIKAFGIKAFGKVEAR